MPAFEGAEDVFLYNMYSLYNYYREFLGSLGRLKNIIFVHYLCLFVYVHMCVCVFVCVIINTQITCHSKCYHIKEISSEVSVRELKLPALILRCRGN
jgi:hypothetical protein